MKNKILIVLFLMLIVASSSVNVFASTLVKKYYTNSNGVRLTEKEYNFVNEIYGVDYFENMTKDDYDWISDLDINKNKIEISTYYDNISNINLGMLKGHTHATGSKRLTIIKSCSSQVCTVITNLTWLTNPTIRSYDVIGARFQNASLLNNTITTRVSSSSGTTYSSNTKTFSNGIGTAVKLPTGSTNIVLEQKFFMNPGGTVFASYQHATSNITLATSLQFVVGATGAGSVFVFYGNAVGKYDNMGGVDITL